MARTCTYSLQLPVYLYIDEILQLQLCGMRELALHERQLQVSGGPEESEACNLAHSYRWGSENCNLHFLPPPLLSLDACLG